MIASHIRAAARSVAVCAAVAALPAISAGAAAEQKLAPAKPCAAVQFHGAVTAGQSFLQPLSHGLVFRLRAIQSGWRAEVLPAGYDKQPQPHDLAEIATPPYSSPSPLLVSTDYSFRAQDAAGWSPRRFRFLASAAQGPQLSAALEQLIAHPEDHDAAAKLLAASGRAADGEIRITSVTYTPGTADISGNATGVSSHLRTIQQFMGADKASALGRLDRVEFTVVLQLDPAIYRGSGLTAAKMDCGN